jgi:hypothetical protein
MSDKQDFYVGQVVNANEMDDIYNDVEAAEQNLAVDLAAAQGTDPTKEGGIMRGLVVSRATATVVQVTAGVARDGNGRFVELPVNASVSVVNEGDTLEGVAAGAVGDGSIVATTIPGGSEAWLSLYLVPDTNLSDPRMDGLGNPIDYRQTESFHFRLELGTPAVPKASSRASITADKILLTDLLIDDAGNIRTGLGTGVDGVGNSSHDFNEMGYGLEDTPALYGRRADWIAIDPNGTDFDLWKNALDTANANNKAYANVRSGDPRDALRQFLLLISEAGSASKFGGSEMINGRPVTGKTLSAPGSAVAAQMPSGSIHAQLEALYNKVNTLLSRGSDTLTGSLTATAAIAAGTTLVAGTSVTAGTDLAGQRAFLTPAAVNQAAAVLNALNLPMMDATLAGLIAITDPEANLPLRLEPYGRIAHPHRFYDDFHYSSWIDAASIVDKYQFAGGGNADVLCSGSVNTGALVGHLGGAAVFSTTLAGAADIGTLSGPRTWVLDSAKSLYRFMGRIATDGVAMNTRIDSVGMRSGPAAGNWFIAFVHDYAGNSNNGNWHFFITDGTNTLNLDLGTAPNNLVPAADNYDNLYFAVEDNQSIKVWVSGMTAEVAADLTTASPGAIDLSGVGDLQQLFCSLNNNGTGADAELYLDFWEITDNAALFRNGGTQF